MNIEHKRQGQMDTAICYFYTDTIYEFKHLLKDDAMKMVCINSWKYLVDNGLIKIYAYVIMPNHIHLLWKMLRQNGKESPAGSFAKFTAHQLKNISSAKSSIITGVQFIKIRQSVSVLEKRPVGNSINE